MEIITTRTQYVHDFLMRAGWAEASRTPLASDASNRRYSRLVRGDGTSAVLMDAPPTNGQSILPFVTVAAHLAGIGLSAPHIIAQDEQSGFLLLEDMGDDLFARLLASRQASEETLYSAAVDVLTHLHESKSLSVAPYDAEFMTPLAALAYDWYQFGATGLVDEDTKGQFAEAFHKLLKPLDAQQVLIQRDYHAENLLWLPQRDGPARVGLLDFQDAMLGHPAYDLVSVLQDARRDVSKRIEYEMVTRFLSQNQHDADAFKAAYAILGTQRNLRILGGFSRLCLRDGKAQYIDLLPRVWNHVMTNLKHPVLDEVAGFITDCLPPPTPEILKTLRSKCATCRDR
ncbi:phosphotransferase [uncultured Roseobacter sp.]|uniref:aminoglycoside phosphotransferase family protein n=1 Tax=uncultured Roseobacter sp. TaxID=114847 RepID=UPI00262D43D5|nr:phosphotransferase [uncultured Roseobacter sp.]